MAEHYPPLTSAQVALLQHYRDNYGPGWRIRVRKDWEGIPRSVTGTEADALRALRDTYGPKWLTRYRPEAAPDAS